MHRRARPSERRPSLPSSKRSHPGASWPHPALLAPVVGPNPDSHRGYEPGRVHFHDIVVSEARDNNLGKAIDDLLKRPDPTAAGSLSFLDATLKEPLLTFEFVSLTPKTHLDPFATSSGLSATFAVGEAQISDFE